MEAIPRFLSTTVPAEAGWGKQAWAVGDRRSGRCVASLKQTSEASLPEGAVGLLALPPYPAGQFGLDPARRERPRAPGSRADAAVPPDQRDVPRARVGWHTPLGATRSQRVPERAGETRFGSG